MGNGEKGNIKKCLKIKRIEILNSYLFSLILFTSLFKEASQIYSGLFSSIQCSIKYNVLYEWSLSMIYHCGAQFENVCEIYTLDGAREGLEKWLVTNVYK